MTRLSIFDVPCLCFGQVQQLRKLHPVSRRLIEQQQKFTVGQHEPRRLGLQALLHILRGGGQGRAVLAKPLPCLVEELGGVVILEKQVG